MPYKNLQKQKEHSRRYYQKNKSKIYEYTKKWKKDNPEKVKKYKKQYRQGKKEKFIQYKNNAKIRNYIFNLTFEQFLSFWQKPCYFCDSEIKTIGLDRIDNSKGYELDNVVSCCKICNYMKGKLNKQQFIEHCEKIIKIKRGFIPL